MKSNGNGERAPLRTVLQNFLNHVETLEKKKDGADDQYEKEFQDLKLLSESLKGLPAFSCKEGEKEVNRRKNRYKDILPFDCTRVTLTEITGIPGSDYINANYIRGASGSQAYIASQGPLVHTVTDFWRMVVECDVQVIIMACNEEESGKHKCECYWTDSDQEIKSYGPYAVKLLKMRRMCNDFNLRTMELMYTTPTGEMVTRTVVQFHYWAWPDHGVPTLVRPLLDMVRLIRDCQASETLPLLIHCSAGCGRTGTICAIDFVWGLLRAGKLTGDFSLFELIADMRRQRVAMVQTKDQYILVHRALRELFIEQLKMIDAHPYENLDINGHPLICVPGEIRVEPSYETVFVEDRHTVVSEVGEEDDVLCDEVLDQIPWPVLDFQTNLTPNGAPPLPDKKRKSAGSSPEHFPPTSPPERSNDSQPLVESDIRNQIVTVEDCPKSFDQQPSELISEDEKKDYVDMAQPKASPKTGLVRKSSILKIRSFFEKPNSESRSEKKSKSSGTSARKASSFRLRESPSKFYRTLDDEIPPSAEVVAKDPALVASSPSHTILVSEEENKPPPEEFFETYTKEISISATKSNHEKPSLPVKRSKSMKVYRGFDIRENITDNQGPAVQSKLTSKPQKTAETQKRETVATVEEKKESSDIQISKSPSVTYISTKDYPSQLPQLQTAAKVEDQGNSDTLYAPVLATSSLDRGREPRATKHSAYPTSSTCGSLDRAVQNKTVPTYVNVLIRNQESANSLKLDDDTRQVLKDCQAYLMEDSSIQFSAPDEQNQKGSFDNLSANRPSKERRHSYKNAIVADPSLRDDIDPPLRLETGEDSSVAMLASSSQAVLTKPQLPESTKIHKGKKIHEYEAIWLSAANEIPYTISFYDETFAKMKRNTQPANQDVTLLQKTNEVQSLLSELRNISSKDLRQPTVLPTVSSSSRLENSTSPRLHPDRVLSELQDLVERANRVKDDVIKMSSSSPKQGGNSSTAPLQVATRETKAPAFRPPPPYPAKFYVSLPSPTTNDPAQKAPVGSGTSVQTPVQRRSPPEYKAPPPVKRTTAQVKETPHPTAPPRTKRQTGSSPVQSVVPFPNGPPVPTRTSSTGLAPGIDVDAVAAVMAAAECAKAVPSTSESSSPTTMANKALSKALGKFHATAASFKTKLAQLSDGKESELPPAGNVDALQRDSNFTRPYVYFGDGGTIVSPSETASNVRKKQQYL